MIKSNKLTVGNFISITQSAYKDDIEEVTSFMIEQIDNGYRVFGIPLNQEWLVKLGFEVKPWGFVNEKYPLIFFSLNPDEKYWVELGNGFRINLKYVHTLQNLLLLID